MTDDATPPPNNVLTLVPNSQPSLEVQAETIKAEMRVSLQSICEQINRYRANGFLIGFQLFTDAAGGTSIQSVSVLKKL